MLTKIYYFIYNIGSSAVVTNRAKRVNNSKFIDVQQSTQDLAISRRFAEIGGN